MLASVPIVSRCAQSAPGAMRALTASRTRCRPDSPRRRSSRMICRSASTSFGASSRRCRTSAKYAIPFPRVFAPASGSESWYVVCSRFVNAFWSRPNVMPIDWKNGTSDPGGKFSDPLNAMCSR